MKAKQRMPLLFCPTLAVTTYFIRQPSTEKPHDFNYLRAQTPRRELAISANIVHVLSGLEIGGMERAVIRLASRGLREGMDHTLLLFDKPFRSERLDFSPKDLATSFIRRRPGIDFRFVVKLAKKLVGSRADVVHAHNDTAIFYSALALRFGGLSGTALIGTFRTRPAPGRAARLLTRWAAGRATEITAVSQELSDWLVRSGWVHRCTTIWNGVDLTEFSPAGALHPWRSERDIPKNAVVVGHVGRFAPIKRHADLFDAAYMLQSAELPLHFVLAGDGPLFRDFLGRASAHPNITMLSNVNDVAAFLRSVDIFVLCSEHEGAPQALLEAMACGRAIISTQVGGIPHLVGAGGPAPAARLLPPLRAGQLADEIIRLARDGGARRHLAEAARRRAQLFSFEHEWAQYASLYLAAARN